MPAATAVWSGPVSPETKAHVAQRYAQFAKLTDLQPLHLFGDMDMRDPLVIAKEKIARAALGAGYSIPKTPLARSLGIDDIEKKQ